MPIYEEKLICPLAVRFTQEHIRPVFQHGQDMEATIRAIKPLPGSGQYDVILEAPFPAIEVVRWHQWDSESSEPDADHWFTLDNRRLYCLQRAAAALWPRRVGVAVEALYSASDGIQRKDDSTTVGRSVGIGHSLKALVGRWDWREAVPCHDAEEGAKAHALVAADDSRPGVEQLQSAPAAPGMLELFLQGGELQLRKASSDGSTTGPSTPRSRRGQDGPPQTQAAPNRVRRSLAGKWQGEMGETYEIEFSAGETWTCWRTGVDGSRRFTLWYDKDDELVWWGLNGTLYLDVSDLTSQTGSIRWLRGEDGRPKFMWYRQEINKGARVEGTKQPAKQCKVPQRQSRWVPVQAVH